MAGTPNTSLALSIPITRAASDTSRMKGYMIRVSVTVRSALSASNPGARTCTSHGAVMIPTIVMALRTMTVSVATLSASFHAARLPSVAMVLLNVVMNDVESAPSANRSRSKLGMRKAMVNASMRRPPPNSAAKICSRARPRMRLHRTARPTMPAALVFSFSARGGGGLDFGPLVESSAGPMGTRRYHVCSAAMDSTTHRTGVDSPSTAMLTPGDAILLTQ